MKDADSLLLDIAGQALAAAERHGADAAEAGIDASRGFSVTVRNTDVETLEHNDDHGLAITVYRGIRKGSATISDFSEQAVDQAVAAACNIAKHTSEDECAGPPDAELMATEFPDLDIDKSWDIDIPQAVDLAVECETAMRENARIVNTEGVTVSTGRTICCYANTHGFAHAYPATRHGITAIAVAADNGEMQRDYWFTVNRHASGLENHKAVGRRAAERAIRRLGARKPKTCKTPVLFEASVAAGLLGVFTSAVSGNLLYRKASFLHGMLGERIFPEFIQVYEQPHLPGAMGSAAFDAEGVATYKHVIVQDGVLDSYVLDSYSARQLKMQTTGNAGGVHNLTVDGRLCDVDTLLKTMGTGLLVTELIGHGINLVTGDYSRGAVGFWIENGEICHPVEEVTIAGNLRTMFERVVMIGDDTETRGNIRCGSVLIDEMTLAGG